MDTTFQDWVYLYGGPVKLCKKLGVTHVAVGHWMRRRACPKVETMIEIRKLSKYNLSFDDIIKSTHPRPIK